MYSILDECTLFCNELNKHISKNDMNDTLYCVCIWFGSDLDLYQWKLLQEDVIINSKDSLNKSSSLPFTRYRHILVFDADLEHEEREEIMHMCSQRNIYPLPLSLPLILPYFWQKNIKIRETDEILRCAKDRLQCLFTYYLKHVALFDFDVRLKRSIHSMLAAETSHSHSSFSGCSCLVSTPDDSDDSNTIYMDAFINIYFNDDGNASNRLKDVNLKFRLDKCHSLFSHRVIKRINKYVIRCPLLYPRRKVGRILFSNDKERTTDYESLSSTGKEMFDTQVDAGLFHQFVISAPQKYRYGNALYSNTIFKEAEMNDTLYCVRMWFGSDLDEVHWKLLKLDVKLNSSLPHPSSSSRLPFKRYKHILVIDSTLISVQTATKIYIKCKELGIQLLDIDLCRVIPNMVEKKQKYLGFFNSTLQHLKDRLQCLFAHYLKHVALFDLDVRLKISIHQMLEKSHTIHKECIDKGDIINANTPINSCLVSTKRNREDPKDVLLDAFINVRLTKWDDELVSDFDTLEKLYDMNYVRLYMQYPCGINRISDYVYQCPMGTRHKKDVDWLLFPEKCMHGTDVLKLPT